MVDGDQRGQAVVPQGLEHGVVGVQGVGAGDGPQLLVPLDPLGRGREDAAPLEAHAERVVEQRALRQRVVLRVQLPVPRPGHGRIVSVEVGVRIGQQRGGGHVGVPVRVDVRALLLRQRGAAHVDLEARRGRPEQKAVRETPEVPAVRPRRRIGPAVAARVACKASVHAVQGDAAAAAPGDQARKKTGENVRLPFHRHARIRRRGGRPARVSRRPARGTACPSPSPRARGSSGAPGRRRSARSRASSTRPRTGSGAC